MINVRTLASCGLGLVCLSGGVSGQGVAVGTPEIARYRNFELRSDVATIVTLTGVSLTEARAIHQRPALLQDLQWRPSRWISGSSTTSTDAVDQIVFSFHNDQLFRLVIDYRYDSTEGMTDADMTEAMSTVYGPPQARGAAGARATTRVEMESGTPLARWGDARHAVVLYRSSPYRAAFRLIVTDSSLDALARKAQAEAVRLDEVEAPRRDAARLKKEQDEARAAAEKARASNKEAFRP
jgi:hypothetical protein